MASTVPGPQQLQELIARLDGHLTSRRFKKALKTVDDGLALSPEDDDLLSCKAGLLVELERFSDAIQLIEGTSTELQKRLSFLLAYARYRERDFKGALTALEEAAAEKGRGTVSLEAQIRYRLGQYDLAAELYERLVLTEKVSGPEVATNLVAAYVSAGRSSEVPSLLKKAKISPADGFELAFNAGCALLGAGDARAAQEMLTLARQTGEQALQEEGLEDEEVAAELAAVDAQLAVAKHRLELEDVTSSGTNGTTENTLEQTYSAALQAASEGTDTVAEAIIAHNLLALAMRKGGRREISAALARLQAAALERVGGYLRIKPDLNSRLGPETSSGLLTGIAAAAISSSKNRELVGEMLALVQERTTKNSDELAVLHTAALANEGKLREAQSALEVTGGPYAGAARAQLAAMSGDLIQAAALLRTLPKDIIYRPGVLSTIAALSVNGGTKKARGKDAGEALEVRSLLDEAQRYWSGQLGSEEEEGASLAQASLGWVLERLARNADFEGDLSVAARAYRELESTAPTRWAASPEAQRSAAWTAALAGAELGPGLSKLAEQLPRLDRAQEESLATASLAAVPAPPTPAAARESGTVEALQEGTPTQKKRRSRKRKVRYPKGFDPENPGPLPNPERWLPKWERSDAKKGRKKRRDKETVRGSQGAGKVDESLDRGKAPLPAETSKPAPTGRAGPRKKGKGGRR